MPDQFTLTAFERLEQARRTARRWWRRSRWYRRTRRGCRCRSLCLGTTWAMAASSTNGRCRATRQTPSGATMTGCAPSSARPLITAWKPSRLGSSARRCRAADRGHGRPRTRAFSCRGWTVSTCRCMSSARPIWWRASTGWAGSRGCCPTRTPQPCHGRAARSAADTAEHGGCAMTLRALRWVATVGRAGRRGLAVRSLPRLSPASPRCIPAGLRCRWRLSWCRYGFRRCAGI